MVVGVGETTTTHEQQRAGREADSDTDAPLLPYRDPRKETISLEGRCVLHVCRARVERAAAPKWTLTQWWR